MSDKKKKAAAIAGALLYLGAGRAVEPDGALMAPAVEPVAVSPGIAPGTSIWGLSGRQAQMQTRSLVQLKAFRTI